MKGARRGRAWILLAVALLAVAAITLLVRSHRAGVSENRPASPMNDEPRLMLWAWETPEDLRTLDHARAGVAFLAREVILAQHVTVRPRLQPLVVPEGTWMMAVVRLEATPSFTPTAAVRLDAAAAILGALSRPGVRALQIDFDATASQRDFYAALLRDVDRALPKGVPLSITALVSWCGSGSWLTALPSGPLPVDEAVPMFFRMGGPAQTRALRPRDGSGVSARVCQGSAGISTDEARPKLRPEQRVYVFQPHAWTETEIATLNRLGYVGVHGISP